MKKLIVSSLLTGVVMTSVQGMVGSPEIFRQVPKKLEIERSYQQGVFGKHKDFKEVLFSNEEDLKGWMLKSPRNSEFQGTSTSAAIEKHGVGKNEVIVAVIDSGIDINHPALSGKIWINKKEANGLEGVDDDNNGYVDDVHGWNFLGNVYDARLEAVEVYIDKVGKIRKGIALRKKSKKLLEKSINAIFDFWGGKESLISKAILVKENIDYLIKIGAITTELGEISNKTLKEVESKKYSVKYALKSIASISGKDDVQVHLQKYAELMNGRLSKYLKIYFNFDPAWNPWKELDEQGKHYGDAMVSPKADDEDHGTHVAAIIAGNSEEMKGIAGDADIKIMSLRVVPNGDERDKDVANAIRYAAKNGAKIINMSFGKGVSTKTYLVHRAIKYAQKKGVLLVHAAGNDSKKISYSNNYPNKKIGKFKKAKNFMEIGASSYYKGEGLVAGFTNFSNSLVDTFAPGHKIYSAIPNGKYAAYSGTSMASPAAAGMAALILSHKPKYSPIKVKRLMKKYTNKYSRKLKVKVGEVLIPFRKLSLSNGITDLEKIFDKILK